MIKHFCDRCDKEIPNGNDRTYVQPKDHCGDRIVGMKSEYELCPKCRQELEKFLGGKTSD